MEDLTNQEQAILDSLYSATPVGQFTNFIGDIWPLLLLVAIVWYLVRRANIKKQRHEEIMRELRKANPKNEPSGNT